MKLAITLPVLLAALSLPALADNYSLPKNVAFEEECTTCHIAYPTQMLEANSWLHMMNDLTHHFGADASLDDKRRAAITDFLAQNSGGRKTGRTADAKGNSLLRITDTSYFQREHREVQAATWKRASIKSPANCGACHTKAAAGDYSERSIIIPK